MESAQKGLVEAEAFSRHKHVSGFQPGPVMRILSLSVVLERAAVARVISCTVEPGF